VPHSSRGPTVEDVALRAGVSRATAARALGGAARVRPATRELVLRVAGELGYVAHASASALAAGRGTRILIAPVTPHGVTWLDPCPYLDRVVRAAAEVGTAHGLGLTLRALPLDDDRVLDTVARDRDLAGVVLVNAHARLLGHIARRLPGRVVSIGAGSDDVPLVDVDTRNSAAALTAHLLDAGLRQVALVAGPTRVSCTARVRRGYAELMTEAGLPVRILPAPFTRAGGRAAAEAVLRRWPGTDAVVASCDEAALGVIEVLTEHGRRVPDDVAVTGFDDLPLAEYAGLTSATHPVEEIATAAVRRVLGGSGPLEQWFPAEPVLRRTA
jgi:DNA-binding LacI/PurR family transcriptional regulator